MESMERRKVVVIGANSFSGQDFVDLLLDKEYSGIIGISRSTERSDVFLKYKRRDSWEDRYRYYQIDLNTEMEKLLQLLDDERPNYIVNFAAQSNVETSWKHPDQYIKTNCASLSRMINHLKDKIKTNRNGYLERYLHISTPEVYGTCLDGNTDGNKIDLNPSTPYAVSKACADMILNVYHRQFNFPLLTIRATNVYGAGQQLFKIIPRTIINIKLGKKIELHGGGKAIKSFIHIRDVSEGELAVLEKGKFGQIYHLSPVKTDLGILSIENLVKKICIKMGVKFVDITKIVEERPGQDSAYIINSDKARNELGWLPIINFDDGLNEVINWIEKYWSYIKEQPLEYMYQH